MSSVRKPNKGAGSNGATPSSSRKRKAPDANYQPSKKRTPTPSQSQRKSQGASSTPQTIPSTEGTPFTVESPAKPPKAGKNTSDDVFRGRDDGGIPELAIDYAVRPGTKWASMKVYKNVKLSEQTFSTGNVLYINRHSPALPPPSEDAPASELLKYDRENLWVGRILECRAESERDVFLRIFWLYWPEELPMGRQQYHGEKELVQSNAMDIIDAQSIASAARVDHWDEKNEEGDADLGERFWRQTFDVQRLGKTRKGGLSEVRRHCTCQKEYNPDQTMYKCVAEHCGIWNHEECLIANVLDRTYHQSLTGTLPGDNEASKKKLEGSVPKDESIKQETPKSPSKKYPTPAEKIGDLLTTGYNTIKSKARDFMTPDPASETEEAVPTKGGSSVVASQVPGFPWSILKAGADKKAAGKFTATVANEDLIEGKGKVIARVVDIRGVGGKKGAKKEAKEWMEDGRCLRCGTILE